MKRSALVRLAGLTVSGVLWGAQGNTEHFIRASGEATVQAQPDRAQISVGLTTHAQTGKAAAADNANQTTKLIDALKQAIGRNGQVQTSGYSLSPQYDYSKGNAPRLIGYQASNTVTATVDDLSKLANVIDTATQTGATNVNGISFMLKNDLAVRTQALTEATRLARANAETIAKALGSEVVGVLSAEPTDVPIVRPLAKQFSQMRMAAEAMAPTPIEAGNLDIHATVVVTLQIR